MIYFTTFILTLMLSHIVRAMPACGDVTPPEELYDPMYADYADGQHAVPAVLPPFLFNVTGSSFYDNPNGDTKKVACFNFAHRYPHFGNIPLFPFIGGSFFIKRGSMSCFSCWNLTNPKNQATVRVTVINSAKNGYNISKDAFHFLNRGGSGASLEAFAHEISPRPCGVL
jgi:hypothetical protein